MPRSTRASLFAVAIAGALTASSAPTSALIVQGTRMVDPPNFVGWWRGASAVAIGPHHLISARHQGGTPGEDGFSLNGGFFMYTSVAITQHPIFDIEIIEIKETLPGWHPIATRVKKGNQVYVGGLGRTAGNISSSGVAWSELREERWGRNKIDKIKDGMITIGFSKPGKGVANEATFAMGDSGAGLFVMVNNQLQLVGIANGTEGAGFSRYNSRGYAVDVVALRSWIQGVVEGR